MTDDDIIDAVLRYEGGFTNDPVDLGGATNFGITAADLGRSRTLGRAATPDEVRNMTRDEARAIYKARYIDKPGFGVVADTTLKWVLVDTGVLHGTGTAVKWLQRTLGVTSDGVIGAQTTNALQAADAAKLARGVLAIRIQRYPVRVKELPSQLRFLEGWVNRATSILQTI